MDSKQGFHEMFKKTYGILYEQNAYVFTDFFKELESYYAKGTVSTFPLPLFPPSEFDYLDLKMARLRFISLSAENFVRSDSDQFMLEQHLRCPQLSLLVTSRERECF